MTLPKQDRIVLLVEDSDDDAFFFERAVLGAATGSEFTRVTDGGAAVEYLQRVSDTSADLSKTHIVFLDLKLPVLSGFGVLKWIREQGLNVEVVILSGSDLDSDLEMARQLGASDYLVKPITASLLRKVLLRENVAN